MFRNEAFGDGFSADYESTIISISLREDEIMSTFADLQDARAYFAGDLFAIENGVQIEELTSDSCLCSLNLTDHHRNAMGAVMGGVIFTLADLAFAVSANNDHHPTVSMTSTVHFLSPVRGKQLYARTRRVKTGRNSAVWEVEIRDELGTNIALLTGTGFKL